MLLLKHKEDSDKVKRTKQILKDAFIELYKNRAVNKISVKEITNLTGLNRGTFYIHFQDIYDLLEQIEEEVLFEIRGIICKTILINNTYLEETLNNNIFGYVEILKYVKKRSEYFEALLGLNGDASFVNKLKNSMKENLNKYFEKIGRINNELSEYVLEYIASANLGLIVYWVETGMEMSVEDLTLMLANFTFMGPLSVK